MRLPALPLAAALLLAAGCAGPSPAPSPAVSPAPLPGSPDSGRLPEPPRYLLPPGERVAGYEPVNPAAYDPRFLSSELGVVPTRFEDLPYLTKDALRFVHVQVVEFNTSSEAGAAYRNYTATLPEGLCPNRTTLGLGDGSLLCDNRGRTGSYATLLQGRSLLVAFTHDANRTPFDDLTAFALRTAELLGGR